MDFFLFSIIFFDLSMPNNLRKNMSFRDPYCVNQFGNWIHGIIINGFNIEYMRDYIDKYLIQKPWRWYNPSNKIFEIQIRGIGENISCPSPYQRIRFRIRKWIVVDCRFHGLWHMHFAGLIAQRLGAIRLGDTGAIAGPLMALGLGTCAAEDQA